MNGSRVGKILIATVFWKRHDVFEMFCKNNGKFADILAVGSEGKRSRRLAEDLGCHYYEAPNKPLGAKFNARIKWFMTRPEYSHILLLGSDDLMCKRTFERIERERFRYDLISWKDIYFYDLADGSGAYANGYSADRNRKGEPFAPGRCISKGYLRQIGQDLWPEKMRAGQGLDKNIWNLKLKGCKSQVVLSLTQNKSIIVDVKTDANVTSLEAICRTTNSRKLTLQEQERIRSLINESR